MDIGTEIPLFGRKGVNLMKARNQTMAPQPTKTAVLDTPAETSETSENGQIPAMSPFETKVLEQAASLIEYAEATSAEVDRAVKWDDAVNPLMFGVRRILEDLDNTSKGALMDAPAIQAVADIAEEMDIPALVSQLAQLADKVRPAHVDANFPDEVNEAASRIQARLADPDVADLLSTTTRATAKAALDTIVATQAKVNAWLKRTNRDVPSKVGTKLASGTNGVGYSSRLISVHFEREDGKETYHPNQGDQSLSYVMHAIQEKMLDYYKVYKVAELPIAVKADIKDALHQIADGTAKVTKGGVGTFTRV